MGLKAMSKQVSKAAGNWLCQARLKAAKYQPDFLTRVGAVSHLSGITEDCLKKYELDISTPSSEAVAIIADAYNQPELRDYYCANNCPLGNRNRALPGMPPERSLIRLQCYLEEFQASLHDLADIMEDGKVSADEMQELLHVQDVLLEYRRRVDEGLSSLEKAIKTKNFNEF